MNETHSELPLYEMAIEQEAFKDGLLRGLSQSAKAIPCKYLYDKRGSVLFDAITQLDEYYLTRTELAIMRQHGTDMAAALGDKCLLIEYGSGSSRKIHHLLDHLESPRGYVPIDISRQHLIESAAQLAKSYPSLRILPIWADYTQPFALPPIVAAEPHRAVYFPGSTIGNFTPVRAGGFLARLADVVGPGGGFLVGIDLKKDSRRINLAYNDLQGITAQFNLNLLVRANRELGADFDLRRFEHLAYYNPACGRVEVYIVSRDDQYVTIAGRRHRFEADERILTEYSYKYSVDELGELARPAGFTVEQVWTDPEQLFAVLYLVR